MLSYKYAISFSNLKRKQSDFQERMCKQKNVKSEVGMLRRAWLERCEEEGSGEEEPGYFQVEEPGLPPVCAATPVPLLSHPSNSAPGSAPSPLAEKYMSGAGGAEEGGLLHRADWQERLGGL